MLKGSIFSLALLVLAAPGIRAQSGAVNFDGPASGPQAFHPGQFVFRTTASHTPETRMVREVKAAVVEILAAVSWAEVADADLPIDGAQLSSSERGMLGQMSPDEIRQYEKTQKKRLPRVSRDTLPDYSAAGSGTGFIVRAPNGRALVITNAHVARLASDLAKGLRVKAKLHIKLSDDQFAAIPTADDILAEVGAVGRHGLDVAFLKLPRSRRDGKPWAALNLGDSSKAADGEDVWALGFPEQLNCTTTKGIISAVHVNAGDTYVSYIQTDAAINPGNSGGPLLHMTDDGKAEVIGMSTKIISRAGGSIGLGFAIESNDIRRALAQYARTGSVSAGYIGMTFGFGAGADRNKILAKSVAPDGPAAKAGLQAGDVILRVAGQDLRSSRDCALFQVQRAVKAKDPGQRLELVIRRDGRDIPLSVVVDKEPADLPDEPGDSPQPRGSGPAGITCRLDEPDLRI